MVTLIGPIIGHPYAYDAAEQGEQVSPVSCFPGLKTLNFYDHPLRLRLHNHFRSTIML